VSPRYSIHVAPLRYLCSPLWFALASYCALLPPGLELTDRLSLLLLAPGALYNNSIYCKTPGARLLLGLILRICLWYFFSDFSRQESNVTRWDWMTLFSSPPAPRRVFWPFSPFRGTIGQCNCRFLHWSPFGISPLQDFLKKAIQTLSLSPSLVIPRKRCAALVNSATPFFSFLTLRPLMAPTLLYPSRSKSLQYFCFSDAQTPGIKVDETSP